MYGWGRHLSDSHPRNPGGLASDRRDAGEKQGVWHYSARLTGQNILINFYVRPVCQHRENKQRRGHQLHYSEELQQPWVVGCIWKCSKFTGFAPDDPPSRGMQQSAISSFTETFLFQTRNSYTSVLAGTPVQRLADNPEAIWSGSFDNQLQCSQLCLLSRGQRWKSPWSNQLCALTVSK